MPRAFFAILMLALMAGCADTQAVRAPTVSTAATEPATLPTVMRPAVACERFSHRQEGVLQLKLDDYFSPKLESAINFNPETIVSDGSILLTIGKRPAKCIPVKNGMIDLGIRGGRWKALLSGERIIGIELITPGTTIKGVRLLSEPPSHLTRLDTDSG